MRLGRAAPYRRFGIAEPPFEQSQRLHGLGVSAQLTVMRDAIAWAVVNRWEMEVRGVAPDQLRLHRLRGV
jgi:hypothetical protein